MSMLQDLTSDSEAESSVNDGTSCHTEDDSMKGASAVSGNFVGSFHFLS